LQDQQVRVARDRGNDLLFALRQRHDPVRLRLEPPLRRGRPLNADMLKGTGGKEPAFICDRDGMPLRMFACAAPG